MKHLKKKKKKLILLRFLELTESKNAKDERL